MALNHIDLNIIPMEEEEYVYQQNANIVPNLPDLNINIGESIDLNIIPNMHISQISLEEDTHDPIENNNIQNADDDDVENNNVQNEENDVENNIHVNIESEFDSEVITQRRMLSNSERRIIYEALLEKSVDGKLKKGVTKLVSSLFSVNIRTVQRIWKLAENRGVHADVTHKKVGNCGRKRVHIDLNLVRDIPLKQRTSIRSLSHALEVSTSTLVRSLKLREIRRHSNAIKPYLTEENKRARLQFCVDMLDSDSIHNNDPSFKGMYNIVHIDEKWFYMKEKSRNFYLVQDEEDPIRTCKSKNFIPKVMFLVAIARPRFNLQQNVTFSGLIGVYPFVIQEPARRSSVNRPAGTLETKAMTSITKDVMRTFLIQKVLPAIKEKWPKEEIGHPIFIQQDNARTHLHCEDEEFRLAATQDGFDIRLMCQPPNSPDLNVLDLGFFSSIQALQHRESPNSIDELVSAVDKSFQEFEVTKSNHIFLTLQSCMIEIMKARGSHNYKIPHMKKKMLEARNQLPTRLKCDNQLVQDVMGYLDIVADD
ncbi:uncharacterized protein LOC127094292 [Lathyrus oleraceus]|uniref:uncharacterized protein LOC127094292 n=1 Tax=Pisum sativum TaxID=3888 RepID=UPI0021D0E97E|nr:uncharacterized protein LOC127094292 [Pisum sativum]